MKNNKEFYKGLTIFYNGNAKLNGITNCLEIATITANYSRYMVDIQAQNSER